MELKDRLHNLLIECSDEEVEVFKTWMLRRMWDEYAKEYMDKRVVIENAVNDLPIKIPNGTVGKEYNTSFDIPNNLVKDFWIEGLENTGLKFTVNGQNECSITGIPTVSGSIEITLVYRPDGWVEGRESSSRKFSIAINPDPRTLWKDIPTPTDIDYYQPDSTQTYVKVEAVNGEPQKDIVAASQRGRSHAMDGKPRVDHFRVEYLEDCGWYIMAVADGAGSAKYSRMGSTLACNVSVEHCKAFFADKDKLSDFEKYITTYKDNPDGEYQKQMTDQIYRLIGGAVFGAHKAIKAEAEAKSELMKSYHTTLLFALCKKFPFGWFVASYWVGDGAMCIYDKERHYIKLLGIPDGGEYAGQTRFLTMPEMVKDANAIYGRLRFSIEQDFTALMLMTDGVSDPKFEVEANLSKVERWDALYDDITKEVELTDDNSESQSQLLKWLDFWSQGNHDDRTIAILY